VGELFLLVPAYLGSLGQRAVKWLLLLLLLLLSAFSIPFHIFITVGGEDFKFGT